MFVLVSYFCYNSHKCSDLKQYEFILLTFIKDKNLQWILLAWNQALGGATVWRF